MHKRPQGSNHLLVLKMSDVTPVSRNLAPCNKRVMVSSVFVWCWNRGRISIGRRQRRVRERGLPDPLPDPKSSGTKKG